MCPSWHVSPQAPAPFSGHVSTLAHVAPRPLRLPKSPHVIMGVWQPQVPPCMHGCLATSSPPMFKHGCLATHKQVWRCSCRLRAAHARYALLMQATRCACIALKCTLCQSSSVRPWAMLRCCILLPSSHTCVCVCRVISSACARRQRSPIMVVPSTPIHGNAHPCARARLVHCTTYCYLCSPYTMVILHDLVYTCVGATVTNCGVPSLAPSTG
jgi:hypothetical protein